MPGDLVATAMTAAAAKILPHALPGFIAWVREQGADDETTLALLDLHKMVLVTPDYYDWGNQIDRWHVQDENPDLGELRAGRLRLTPGLFELHCRECRETFPCKTVRVVAGGCRDRTGFGNGWAL